MGAVINPFYGKIDFIGNTGGGGNTGSISAGTTKATLGQVVFSNSNGVSFGVNGQTVTATVQTNYLTTAMLSNAATISNINISGGTTSSNLSNFKLIDSNGVSWSLDTGSKVYATVKTDYLTTAMLSNAATISNINVSGGTTSSNLSNFKLIDSNGVSWSLDTGSKIYATVKTDYQSSNANYLTSQSTDFNAVTLGGNTAGTSTFHATNNRTIFLNGGNNITLSGNGSTITISGANQTNQTVGVYMSSNTTSSNSSGTVDARSMTFRGMGIASVGHSNGEVIISVPSGGGAGDGYNILVAGTRTAGTASSVVFSNSNNFTFGMDANPGSVITASYSESNQTMGLYALGNTTQNSSSTMDARTMSFNALGAMTWGYSNGSIQVSAPATSSIVGTNGVQVSSNASTIYVQLATASSYQNLPGLFNSSALTFNQTSISQAVAFKLDFPISCSFLRIPALMTTNSTTIATMASATATASGALYSTINAVIYSLGVGGNSKSLQSVASGSAGYTFQQSVSITNSTQGSYTLALSGQANGGGTTRTTQYSISNTNYSFTTNAFTEFTSGRFLDIPFASSINAGNYWLVLGMSTSTASAGAAGLAALTNCNVRYSNHYGASQANVGFGVFGSTNMTSGGQLGVGFFSTAGGGTTNSIPISAISSTASNPTLFFQLLRSA